MREKDKKYLEAMKEYFPEFIEMNKYEIIKDSIEKSVREKGVKTFMKTIRIERTEQWEYTAYGYGMSTTGSSEINAERNLLRKVVDMLEKDIKKTGG